ncbi:MAG: serine/threonine-protein kinase, partial [Acidobacteriota bacterium]
MPDRKLCVVCSRVFLGDMTTCSDDGAPLVTQASDVPEGRVLGNYRLLRQLGEGGVGAVYEAEHVVLGRKRAIKVLHPDAVTDELVVRFFNEARAVNEIRHPNIIDIEDFVTTEHGEHFLVMELLEGEELRSVLHREIRLAPARVVAIGEQIASALAAVHGVGIIHRDLKPENIFLTKDADGRELAKLLDFGIAKFVNEAQGVTRDGMTVGTPDYMSPEQIMGSADVGSGTDLYALGMVMYEALTGAPAFSGSLTAILHAQCLEAIAPPSKRRGEPISPVLDAAVLKCLAKKPSHRFASAGELVQALRADRPVQLASDSFKPIREVLPPRRRHHVVLAVGLAAAVAVAGVAFRLARRDDTPKLAALAQPATPPPVAAPPPPVALPPPAAASPS